LLIREEKRELSGTGTWGGKGGAICGKRHKNRRVSKDKEQLYCQEDVMKHEGRRRKKTGVSFREKGKGGAEWTSKFGQSVYLGYHEYWLIKEGEGMEKVLECN